MLDKAKEVSTIRKDLNEWYKRFNLKLKEEQSCFYQAIFTHQHLKTLNLGRVLISAGSLSYPRIDLKKDDGKIATHFSYIFDPNVYEVDSMQEMHVWVQLPDRLEIVDITTRYLKSQCENLAKMPWLAPEPPDFLWCKVNELPEGVHYEPHKKAVQLVQEYFKRTWNV